MGSKTIDDGFKATIKKFPSKKYLDQGLMGWN